MNGSILQIWRRLSTTRSTGCSLYKSMNTLLNTIDEMKALGDRLIEFTHPRAATSLEDDITVLRSRDIVVDGYQVTVFFSKADYGEYRLETFQVLGKWMPFIPFNVVCKLARKFLGDKDLSLVEIFLDQRKTYVWTLTTDPEGRVKPPVQSVIYDMEYDGLKYHYMDPTDVNFF